MYLQYLHYDISHDSGLTLCENAGHNKFLKIPALIK